MAMPEGGLGLARKDAGICQPLRKLGGFEFQQVMGLAVQRLTVAREAIKRILVWLFIFVCWAPPFSLR
jgi:hypothetical protein